MNTLSIQVFHGTQKRREMANKIQLRGKLNLEIFPKHRGFVNGGCGGILRLLLIFLCTQKLHITVSIEKNYQNKHREIYGWTNKGRLKLKFEWEPS